MSGTLLKQDHGGKNSKLPGVVGNIIRIVVICAILVVYVGPFYISFLYSVKSHTDISRNRLAWPEHPTFENYINVVTRNQQFITGYKNSILTTIPTVLILMIITSMAAYVLARYNTKFYKFIYVLLISGILIPFQCIMLPLYLNIYNMGLTSSNLGFILVRTGMQVSISILVVTGFVKTVPRELEEAANIDGCNRFATFWRIVFPLMKPVNATQLVLNSLFVWNDYNVAVVLLRTAKSRTLPLAQIMYFNENTSELNLAFAFFTLVMLPILVLYLVMQKHIVSGVMSGAIKG
ncbi:sugar ABC transporter permease [Spirochaetia bacterium]|nr:sugar ABC transporter permease [Spirochaetia bacterium]